MQTLRTAKLALEEQLINQEDFNVIKNAFLKAQQIKAGMDAGFLRQEDYLQARTSFLQSLDFDCAEPQAHGVVPAASNSHAAAPHHAAAAAFSTPGPNNVVRKLEVKAPAAVLTVPKQQQPQQQQQHAPSAVPAAVHHATNGASSPVSSPHAALPELQDLPRLVKPGIAAGKKSMSGIAINEHCINVFNHMKTKSTFKWVTYKIDDAGKDVVVDALGPSTSLYGEFIAALQGSQCRYGVFDYAYTNADTQQTINKLVFVNWAPDNASTRTKMMYASTKDFFKGFLDGVGAELQATDMDELEEAEMKERIHQALTRK